MNIQICDKPFQTNIAYENNIHMQTIFTNNSVKKTHEVFVGKHENFSVVNASRPQAQQPWLVSLGNAFLGMQKFVIGHVKSLFQETDVLGSLTEYFAA